MPKTVMVRKDSDKSKSLDEMYEGSQNGELYAVVKN